MLGNYDTGIFDFGDGTLDQDDTLTTLPNSVQLIESKMLPIRACNWNQLSGMYLFCQIYSQEDDKFFCLSCIKQHQSIAELKHHYQTFHDFAVITRKAEYDKTLNFECYENTDSLYRSAYCKAKFESLIHLSDHYIRRHELESADRSLLKLGSKLLKRVLYCGLCGVYSKDFYHCLRHLEDVHGMKTNICRYCTYCNPVLGFVRIHELQMHFQYYPEKTMQCSICLIHVRGADRLTKHVMVHHVVQTGPNYWSCSTCYRTYSDPLQLMEHLETCSKLHPGNESIFKQTSRKKDRIIYTCDFCSLVFASEEEFERHVGEDKHLLGTPETKQTSVDMDDAKKCDPSVFDPSTCFLCCTRFATPEMCWKHQHHVHMEWVTKGEADHGQKSEYGNKTTDQELESTQTIEDQHVPEKENNLEPVIEYVLENDIPSFTYFVEQQLAQMHELHTISTEENQYQKQATIHEQTGYISISPQKPFHSSPTEPMNLVVAEVNNSEMNLNQEVEINPVEYQEQATIHDQPGCISIPSSSHLKSTESLDLVIAEVNNNNRMNLNQEVDIHPVRYQEKATIHEQPGCIYFPSSKPSKSPESLDLIMPEVNNNNRMNLNQEVETHQVEYQEQATIHDQTGYDSISPSKSTESMDLVMAEVNNTEMNLNQEVIQNLEARKAKVCSNITLGAVQVQDELADIGYPNKFGHYCELCDQVIENYWFYYLHMRNFHRLEKRFKCAVTSCSKVFSGTIEFQNHAFKVHNQNCKFNCRQCDVVFGSVVEMQDHVKNSAHMDKLKRLVEEYARVYPRNHRCSICHCWFGLFSIFVEHMETNGHIYINVTN